MYGLRPVGGGYIQESFCEDTVYTCSKDLICMCTLSERTSHVVSSCRLSLRHKVGRSWRNNNCRCYAPEFTPRYCDRQSFTEHDCHIKGAPTSLLANSPLICLPNIYSNLLEFCLCRINCGLILVSGGVLCLQMPTTTQSWKACSMLVLWASNRLCRQLVDFLFIKS